VTGADSITNASTSGVTVIAPNSVRFNTGDNHAQGYVARWTNIKAGTGTLTIRAKGDPSSRTDEKAYAFSVFMLSQTRAPGVVVNTKLLLEGPLSGTTMTTTLNTSGTIPKQQPYNTTPWNYAGAETASSIPAGVVDWVLVELRTGTAGSTRVASRAAFVKSDGSIVDTNGVSLVGFPGVAQGSYYVVIKHRNHLGIMSAAPLALTSTSALYDFTTATTQAYGTNAMKLVGSVYTMLAGDGNADGVINAVDRNTIWRVMNGSVGYRSGDFNLDNVTNATDRNSFWRTNNGRAGGVPASRVQAPPGIDPRRVENGHKASRED
jgi:hypothetical protein